MTTQFIWDPTLIGTPQFIWGTSPSIHPNSFGVPLHRYTPIHLGPHSIMASQFICDPQFDHGNPIHLGSPIRSGQPNSFGTPFDHDTPIQLGFSPIHLVDFDSLLFVSPIQLVKNLRQSPYRTIELCGPPIHLMEIKSASPCSPIQLVDFFRIYPSIKEKRSAIADLHSFVIPDSCC